MLSKYASPCLGKHCGTGPKLLFGSLTRDNQRLTRGQASMTRSSVINDIDDIYHKKKIKNNVL